MNSARFIFCWCFFFVAFPVKSLLGFQIPSSFQVIPPSYDLEWIAFNPQSYLGSSISSFCQDEEGYIWLNGYNGIHIFDGIQTLTYGDSSSFFSWDRTIVSWDSREIILSNGYIYINLIREGKLIKVDPRTRKIVHQFSFGSSSISTIGYTNKLENGNLVFTTLNLSSKIYTLHLLYPDNRTKEIYEVRDMQENSSFRITEIVTRDNIIFIRTFDSIIEIDTTGQVINKHGPTFIIPRKNSNSNFHQNSLYSPILKNRIEKIFHIDGLVFAGDHENLFIIDEQKKTIQDLSEPFRALKKTFMTNKVSSNLEKVIPEKGADNFLLLTTSTSGLLRIKPKAPSRSKFFLPVAAPNPTPSFRQSCINDQGEIIAAYYGGLAKLDTLNWQMKPLDLKYLDQPTIDVSFSLNYHNEKLYWNNIAVDQNGVVKSLVPKNKATLHGYNFILGDTIVIFPWSSTKFYIHDSKKEITYTRDFDKDIYQEYYALIEINAVKQANNKNEFWMATAFNGIKKFNLNGDLIKSYNAVDLFGEITERSVFDLELAKDGIWLASYQGLYFLDTLKDEKRLRTFSYINDDGLPVNRIIYTIIPIDNEHWYLGTDKGLIRYNIITDQHLALKEDHPLSNLEFNRNGDLRVGKMNYMGTATGFYAFHDDDLVWEEKIVLDHSIKMIKSEAVSADNNTSIIPEFVNDKFIFPPNSKNLKFHVTYPSLNTKVFYNYRIKSITKEWSQNTTSSSFNIYTIPAGEYELEVGVADDLKEPPKNTKIIKFEIKEVWYKQAWARLLFLLCLVGIIFGIYRYRINEILRYERLRTKISSDLHDDVGSLLTAVALQSELLGMGAEPSKQSKFQRLSQLSREAMGRMRDNVWIIDARKDNLESLIGRMMDFLADMNQQDKFTVKFNYDIKNLQKKLPPDIRQNTYLIFKEAVTNAYKHSNGNVIAVNLNLNGKALQLRIFDNGKVDKSKIKKSGLGLMNLSERADRVDGDLNIDYGEGFKIEFEVNLK